MIAKFFQSVGIVIGILVFVLFSIILIYLSYLFAIACVIGLLIFTVFKVLLAKAKFKTVPSEIRPSQ
jgi:uncharacterized protein YacL